MYALVESCNTMLSRCGSLHTDIAKRFKRCREESQRVDLSHIPREQVIHSISTCIEKHHAGVVIVDSLNGYLQAMSSDRSFIVHLHELLAYLNARGVITILVCTQHG